MNNESLITVRRRRSFVKVHALCDGRPGARGIGRAEGSPIPRPLSRDEQPHLQPLPATGFVFFRQATRTVDDAGLVQVNGAYYAALPAAPHSEVMVRIFEQAIEILDARGELLRRHAKTERKGAFVLDPTDRLFNPSRETARLLVRIDKIGPHSAAFARQLFVRLGSPGHRAIYGLAQLPRTYPVVRIEAVCARLLAADCLSYAALKRALERGALAPSPPQLATAGPHIRPIADCQSFWEAHAQTHLDGEADGNVYH